MTTGVIQRGAKKMPRMDAERLRRSCARGGSSTRAVSRVFVTTALREALIEDDLKTMMTGHSSDVIPLLAEQARMPLEPGPQSQVSTNVVIERSTARSLRADLARSISNH
jgi:hypothetical protein